MTDKNSEENKMSEHYDNWAIEKWDKEFEKLDWLKYKEMTKKRKLGILREDIQKHRAKIEELKEEIEKLHYWIKKVKKQPYRKRKPKISKEMQDYLLNEKVK